MMSVTLIETADDFIIGYFRGRFSICGNFLFDFVNHLNIIKMQGVMQITAMDKIQNKIERNTAKGVLL